MQHKLLPGRRLRFDLQMGEKESIPGAIARGVREHVLVRTAPVLVAAGVQMKHIGLSQIAQHDELQRLAHVTRYDTETFQARGGERITAGKCDIALGARFGRLFIPRIYLELNRRRIAPLTLRDQTYHRLTWMNLLLPYCPESLEKIVHQCDQCHATLGWQFALGIGHCDQCGSKVAPSPDPPLIEDAKEDYRFFAQLSSADAQDVEDACRQLPSTLAAVAPATLVRLALFLGGLVQNDPITTTCQRNVVALPADVLAAVSTAGVALLRDWPHGLHTWIKNKSEALQHSPEALANLRRMLRRFADRYSEAPDLVDLLTNAVPDLEKHKAHSFSHGRRYYLYTEVQRLLGLKPVQMEALKSWDGIKFRRLNNVGKQHGQFDADQIDELVPVFREAVAMNSCAHHVKVPFYAIEQLCGAGLLEWENHPALLEVRSKDFVKCASVDRLDTTLFAAAKNGLPPKDCVSLSVAAKRIGGRVKPWSTIFDALKKGRISFWLNGDVPTTRSIFLRSHEIAAFEQRVDEVFPAGLRLAELINQRDAAEILNISTPALRTLSQILDISFVQSGKGLATTLERVLDVAEKIAWPAEISLNLGVHPNQVAIILARHSIKPIQTGWCRHHLIDAGILPPAPA